MRFKRVLVVDVEASCWQKQQAPPGEETEIIEIGFCELNLESLRLSDPHSLLVKPQRSHISPFCTRLTSITPEMAAGGILFNEACGILRRDYQSQDAAWLSWGIFDLKLFTRQCANYQVSYPFSPQHINFKERFAALQTQPENGKRHQLGFMRALRMTGLEFEGSKHRAGDDAWNTARLLQALVQQHGTAFMERENT